MRRPAATTGATGDVVTVPNPAVLPADLPPGRSRVSDAAFGAHEIPLSASFEIGAVRLLERSAQLSLLDERLRAVRGERKGPARARRGRGRHRQDGARAALLRGRGRAVLWGACDALHTPRPLGPFLDFAAEAGAGLAALAGEGAAPGTLVAALGARAER